MAPPDRAPLTARGRRPPVRLYHEEEGTTTDGHNRMAFPPVGINSFVAIAGRVFRGSQYIFFQPASMCSSAASGTPSCSKVSLVPAPSASSSKRAIE